MRLAAKDHITLRIFLDLAPELVQRGYLKDDLERKAIQHLDSHQQSELVMSLHVLKTHGKDLEDAGFDKGYQLEQLSREDSARYLCKIIRERTSVATSGLPDTVRLMHGTTNAPITP
jgi:hypothetical protein